MTNIHIYNKSRKGQNGSLLAEKRKKPKNSLGGIFHEQKTLPMNCKLYMCLFQVANNNS